MVACVGGGSNCIGMFDAFVQDAGMELLGIEAGGDMERHAASIEKGSIGILHGSTNFMIQDRQGQSGTTHSVSAGLDYSGVSPIHSFLSYTKRATYRAVNNMDAIRGYNKLAMSEGICCCK